MAERRWVVGPSDGPRVADVLSRMGEAPGAIAEGRVFVGRRRAARADEKVREGDEIRVSAPVAASAEVLFEQDGLVACVKPAGIPSVPDHAGSAHSLVDVVARATKRSASELYVTSRLDREVSGVVVFAVTAEAEQRLRRARAEGAYERRYVALASTAAGAVADAGAWRGAVGRARDPRRRAVDGVDAKASETRFVTVARAPLAALLAVAPVTGRTHQIRVHASHAGVPLLGDRDYGGPSRLTLPSGRVVSLARVALHAARVTVPGASGAPIVAEAPAPVELTKLWSDLGGDADAWAAAVACAVP